jgi:hypothetical protein
MVGVEDLVAHDVADLVRLHAPVNAGGDDDLDVGHAVIGEQLEHDGQHAFTDVGPLHRRQRHRDVVDGDRHAHARPQLGVQRVRAERMVDRVANRRVGVAQRRHRRLGINATSAGGQVDLDQPITSKQNSRSAVALQGDDTGMIHAARLRSKLGQPYALASQERRLSGFTAAGWPTTLSIGTSE